jgi:hypothetical protein
MAVRPLPLLVTEQTSSLSYGIARSSETKHNCPICGKPLTSTTPRTMPPAIVMHEGCYILRQMLKQSTIPTNGPRA